MLLLYFLLFPLNTTETKKIIAKYFPSKPGKLWLNLNPTRDK